MGSRLRLSESDLALCTPAGSESVKAHQPPWEGSRLFSPRGQACEATGSWTNHAGSVSLDDLERQRQGIGQGGFVACLVDFCNTAHEAGHSSSLAVQPPLAPLIDCLHTSVAWL